MTEHRPEDIEGVEFTATGDKQRHKDYEQSDMEVVFRRNPQAKSWNDLIQWLDTKGEPDKKLTPGETVALKEDLTSLQQAHVPFTDNPDQAYREAHQHRGENEKRFGATVQTGFGS